MPYTFSFCLHLNLMSNSKGGKMLPHLFFCFFLGGGGEGEEKNLPGGGREGRKKTCLPHLFFFLQKMA